MTIAALLRLLDEELPDVPRHPAPWIPHTARKRQTMQQSSAIPSPRDPQQAPSGGLSVATTGALIAWAELHTDKGIVRLGEQARTALQELRTRKASEDELALVDAEEQRLQQQLADLRARREQLRPAQRKAPTRDYVPAVVRAWARAEGMDVPAIGTVPKAIVQAWREATGGAR